MKKTGLLLLAFAIFAFTAPSPAEARVHRHGHYCGYGPYYDYSHGNVLTPYSYIYPAANWGPFFHCRMYYSPVDVLVVDAWH